MNMRLVLAALAVASAAQISYAQFGSGIVYDPTQSAHAAQQILQANQLYTTTLKTTQNVIGAYNLAERMATAPSSLYFGYVNLGRQFWVPFTQPANTYDNLQQFINAIASGNGAAAATKPRAFHIQVRFLVTALSVLKGSRSLQPKVRLSISLMQPAPAAFRQ